jgi:hypothetical protein
MKEIIAALEDRKALLKQSALCGYLRADNETASKLSFAPAMLFFAMGFKDILDCLRADASEDPLQMAVNIHCEEDSTHWMWYLNDMMRIPSGKAFMERRQKELFGDIWSARYEPVRHLVYDCIAMAKQAKHPFQKLILIEALEATFECFNEPVFDHVHKIGLSEVLEYFGQAHAHSEASHSMDKSGNGQASETYQAYEPDVKEQEQALNTIHTVFDVFERVFDCWYREATTAGSCNKCVMA